jgi:hypothetical protein
MTNKPKFGNGWERYVGPWYVYQGNWQHAIKGCKDGYRLPGSPEPFGTLVEAKAEALRRIANAKPQLARYVQGNRA